MRRFSALHNPTGRVWERWEVEQVMDLFRKYDVMVVSDEIWSDILLEGYTHVPTQSVSEDAKRRTIALYAPSKTFNLAGLVGSYHIIYDSLLRDRMEKQMSLSHYNTMNVMSMYALIGAYKPEESEGGWRSSAGHHCQCGLCGGVHPASVLRAFPVTDRRGLICCS